MQEFARGLQLDGDNVELQEEAKVARQLLSLEELHGVRIFPQHYCFELQAAARTVWQMSKRDD